LCTPASSFCFLERLSLSEGYLKLRRGIETHLELGYICGYEFAIYCYLLLKADYKSGVVWQTSILKISQVLGFEYKTCGKYVRQLESKKYLKRFLQKGSKRLYPIAISKYEVRDGVFLSHDKTLSVNKIEYESESDGSHDAVHDVGHDGSHDVPHSYIRSKEERIKELKKGIVIFPESLQNEEFGKAWSDWEQDRKDRKKKLTPHAIVKQFDLLETLGTELAIVSINQSIQNGWTGLFIPKMDLNLGSKLDKDFKPLKDILRDLKITS